jgi:hypothetical protein
VAGLEQSELPQRKVRNLIIPADRLRISTSGISVSGEPTFKKNHAIVYEDMCAKLARKANPDKFIISPRVLNKMCSAPGSVFASTRPDILVLQAKEDTTVLWGMQECKSGYRDDLPGDYGLPQKAGGFHRIIEALEKDPEAIGRDLRFAIGESFDKIPIDLTHVSVAPEVNILFITHSEAEQVSPSAYPRMRYSYQVEPVPISLTLPDYARRLRDSSSTTIFVAPAAA